MYTCKQREINTSFLIASTRSYISFIFRMSGDGSTMCIIQEVLATESECKVLIKKYMTIILVISKEFFFLVFFSMNGMTTFFVFLVFFIMIVGGFQSAYQYVLVLFFSNRKLESPRYYRLDTFYICFKCFHLIYDNFYKCLSRYTRNLFFFNACFLFSEIK